MESVANNLAKADFAAFAEDIDEEEFGQPPIIPAIFFNVDEAPLVPLTDFNQPVNNNYQQIQTNIDA